MSANMLSACPLKLAPETLSAWRDNALEAREERRISSHADTCAACQAQLHQFEHIAAVLRSERVPLPAQPLWPGLRERLDRLDTPVALPPHHLRRPAIAGIGGGLAVLAAVLIVAIVHFSLASLPSRGAIQAGPTPSSGPAPTVAPVQQLTWKTLGGPAILNQAGIITYPVFAPGDARTVYAVVCNYSNPSAASEIWATHDGGDSWSIVGHLPAHPSEPCPLLAVDATQSQALVATVGQNVAPNFLSTDGGTTWTSIGTGRAIKQLATYKSLTYALVNEPSSGDSSTTHLVVSSDLRSWQDIDQRILRGGAYADGVYLPDAVHEFWLSSTNGSLLAETSPSGGYGSERLWASDDGGHTWKEITYTGFQPQAVAVQPPAAGRSWDICVTNLAIDSGINQITGNNRLACTTDGGRAWVPRPTLNVPWPYLGTDTVHPLGIITIGADGSLIAAVNQNNAPADGNRFDLYRLPSSSSTWEPIGSAPNPNQLGSFQAYPSGAIVYISGQSYITTYP